MTIQLTANFVGVLFEKGVFKETDLGTFSKEKLGKAEVWALERFNSNQICYLVLYANSIYITLWYDGSSRTIASGQKDWDDYQSINQADIGFNLF